MITLYQPDPMFGLIGISPFCMKLEAFLRLNHIEFEIKPGLPHQGPFKKIPFVDYQDQRTGDSSAIINQLIQDFRIEYHNAEYLVTGPAWQRMAEEHIYWAIVYFRWMDDEAWPSLRDAFFGSVPALIRPLIVAVSRKQVARTLDGQGFGRLPESMILDRIDEDLKVLADWLGQRPYLCGNEITHFDLSVWATLSQILNCDLKIKLTPVAEQYRELSLYLRRIDQKLAPFFDTPVVGEESALAV